MTSSLFTFLNRQAGIFQREAVRFRDEQGIAWPVILAGGTSLTIRYKEAIFTFK
jgi:hypothetical protein